MKQKIPLSYAKPGMVLAEEVADDKGRVLCGPETELSQGLIEKFSSMGIKFVTVKGHPVDLPWEKPLEEELKELEERFGKVVDDKRLMALKALIADYLKNKES
ncbi:hypothetical protein Thein_0521 [Thermodesulfatator indicus DSM 15286]|uniref:Uncharacterized protein n=1 Tax=Thermodesulfatator indicus (strain DSM 15286 / JCM 11887 / CIR29812) TaxID=667014 RepID=F8AB34_THEID|nr:hypothetical protein [Thermodesulfatator indicus]AEH44403.1 hypothetical protein Thein_0521 [Thermodesulfatator indicus DSM 15286]